MSVDAVQRLFLLLGALAATACTAPRVAAPKELALKRVSIYRNGVAYFERSGKIDADRLQFKVRPEHVGDFLATLAVMEKGGSSVRAASFPLHVDEASGEEEEGSPGEPPLQSVVLELDGDSHELAVGYVTEQPVWKPSYRIILGEDGPTLQAWGIVQNVSGEDWKDVQLSLVAGAPISFEATLQTPVTPSRPVINDTGEMISAVPRSESTLAQRPTTPAPPPPAPAAPREFGSESEKAPSKKSRSRPSSPPSSMPRVDSAPQAPPYTMEDAAPRNLSLLASQTVEAGATQYDLPHPVTVPNASATMVLLLVQKVEGEAVFMFAPEGGVPDSARHPFRVVHFKNPTQGLLERGPIAVYGQSAFLGQGLMEPLSSGGQATVPFALDRGLSIDSERKYTNAGARLARIEHGNLQLERDQVSKTTYRVRSGKPEPVRLVLRHPRTQGMTLHKPPEGTDDQVGKGTALVPLKVPAQQTVSLAVEERRPWSSHADWFSPEADEAVKAYLADPRAAPAVAEALRSAWTIRKAILDAQEEYTKLQSERQILANASEETRENLRALAKNKSGVESLRQTLSRRLAELDEKLAKVTRRLVELDLGLNENRVRFLEKVRDVKLLEPLPEA